MTGYAEQERGGGDAYDRYLQGMDASMRQKVALTAAHLLGEGRVADMGMGSGSGTLALASLYPRMDVVGVDVNEEMVRRARRRHVRPNLSFALGDIAREVFEPATMTAIFDSSVLHHVTTFNGYRYQAARDALRAQTGQLQVGGSLIVRDFLAPPPGEVWLDLPADDGDDSQSVTSCSTARLFERFAREFRKLHPQPGFPCTEAAPTEGPPIGPGRRRFRTSHRIAVEFVLRKDYRADWDTEVLEEYTYFTQEEFEQHFADLGLRLLASTPIRNPWIVRHRFAGRFELWSMDERPLPAPPTNYVIVGERVASGEGVRFVETGAATPVGFVERLSFQREGVSHRWELVRRPGISLDVVPWFSYEGSVFVLARKGHPRPVLQCDQPTRPLDGSTPVGYVTEPLLAVQTDKPLGMMVEHTLARAAALEPSAILGVREGPHYYPSPGGLVEEVRSALVEIEPCFVERQVANTTGFSTGGMVRAIDARQLLRAAQVGGLPDARLETSVYELLLSAGLPVGPWIGAGVDRPRVGLPGRPASASALAPRTRRRYVRVEPNETPGFIELRTSVFEESGAEGEVVCSAVREFVLPRELSCNTIACAVVGSFDGVPCLGLDDDDLPAAQCFVGSSALWVAPAWRIPRDVSSLDRARGWVDRRLRETYGLTVGSMVELGGRYHPSAGVTPEVVHPWAAVVDAVEPASRSLTWVPLVELVGARASLRDGHLRIVALRAAHALGLLD